MFTRHFVALSLITATLTACPEGPTFVTTDDASTSAATADAPTTSAAASSTGDDSTTAPSVRNWCDDMQNLCAGTPLAPVPGSGETDYCEIFATQCNVGIPPCQLCNYLLNTCHQLGGGEDCSLAAAECLCLATAHNLDI